MVTQANISELKNRLSHYLGRVRRGESVLVLDRDRVIARIEPAGAAGDVAVRDSDWLDDLERLGAIKRRRKRLPEGWLERQPQIEGNLVEALLEERSEAR